MYARELLHPRYEVIADFPFNKYEVGDILRCPIFKKDSDKDDWIEEKDKYPNIFRKLNWWEYRKAEDMPKKIICKATNDDTQVNYIEEWDMDMLVGWTNKKERKCCSLRSFTPEYGYFPVD